MILATQYYRPPFPQKKHWKEDLKKMKESGLNALQLWAPWGWCEPEPGKFRFEDFDELINLARKSGLGVVLSTIAEIHPFWLLREYPDAVMIDHSGRTVSSGPRGECIVGMTPGGCFDHPHVSRAMENFLKNIAMRYANEKSLLGWDIWNELRWSVHAQGYVCYCHHTLSAFRNYLKNKYKSLDGLNAAWKRRYCSWEDVEPGRYPRSPYTELMEFCRFLTWRAARHMETRCRAIKSADSSHLVSAHGATPANAFTAWENEQPLARGNDFINVASLDGYGCSHFPAWGDMNEYAFGARLETTRSVTGDKTLWVSELQGGSSRHGHQAMQPVPAALQQRWIWSAYSRGAKAVIFWCWRDEVFGSESSGFGLDGNDGHAAERLAMLKKVGGLFDKHASLLEDYRPDPARVGVVFDPDCYYLDWAENGRQEYAAQSHLAYLDILEKLHIPYDVVPSSRPESLVGLKFVILPWTLIIEPTLAGQLIDFVKKGGTLLCEAETDSFDELGFYRYPGADRSFTNAFGLSDLGRRVVDIDEIEIKLGAACLKLKTSQWLTPLDCKGGKTLSQGTKLAVQKTVGKGSFFALGTSIGHAYAKEPYADLETFVQTLAERSGSLPNIKAMPPAKCPAYQFRTGLSGDCRLFFLINSGPAGTFKIEGTADTFKGVKAVRNLVDNKKMPVKIAKGKASFSVPVAKGGCFVASSS